MGRSKDLTLVDRDKQILAMVSEGYSYSSVADTFGISKQRIGQIVQASQAELSDDATRDVGLTQLEFILSDLFAKYRAPDPQLVSARGPVYAMKRVRTSEGWKDVQDLDSPILDPRFKLEVVDRLIKINERIAKQRGTDRLKQKEQDQTAEMNDFLAYVQDTAARNAVLEARLRELSDHQVVTAEILEDSPPPP